MADTPPTPPDKSKKNRSFGAFLLFLTVLVAVLFIYGQEAWKSMEVLTQDQYEYYLVKGQVESQELSGQNHIKGRLKSPQKLGEVEFREFKVEYASLGANEQRLREYKAVPSYQSIPTEEFLDGIARGVYQPQSARLITSVFELPLQPRAKDAEAPARDALRPTAQRTEILLQVIAPSKADYVARLERSPGSDPSEATRFPLPSTSGPFPLMIEDLRDVAPVLAVLEQQKVTPQLLQFDLAKGTSWNDSGSLLQSVERKFDSGIVDLESDEDNTVSIKGNKSMLRDRDDVGNNVITSGKR